MDRKIKDEFIEKVGLASEAEGYPRIAGRIFAFLVINEGAYSLDDLADALRISRASVSTNARLLERDGIITRTSSPGDRRDYYQVAEDHWEHMFEQALRRVTQFHRVFAEAASQLPPDESECRRVRIGERFYATLIEDLEQRLKKWRESIQENTEAASAARTGSH